MNNVCREIVTCIMRKISLFTVRFVAQSVTEYATCVMNIDRRIEHLLATLSTGLIQDHPLYLGCPDLLSVVGDPLSGNGCGSPNHIEFELFFFFCGFI